MKPAAFFTVALNTFLIIFASAHVQAQSTTQTPLSVYDANGQAIGAVTGFTFTVSGRSPGLINIPPVPVVALRGGGLVLMAGVLRNQLVGTQPQIYFESSDCSGTPLLPSLGGHCLPQLLYRAI
jgi:hypothetical protein